MTPVLLHALGLQTFFNGIFPSHTGQNGRRPPHEMAGMGVHQSFSSGITRTAMPRHELRKMRENAL